MEQSYAQALLPPGIPSSSSSSSMAFMHSSETKFVKVELVQGGTSASEIKQKMCEKFPSIIRAYNLANFVTFTTKADMKIVTAITTAANKLAAYVPPVPLRLYVKNIGGLSKRDLESIFSRHGTVQEVVVLSPRGNPTAIVILLTEDPIEVVCRLDPSYTILSPDGCMVEKGSLLVYPAREKERKYDRPSNKSSPPQRRKPDRKTPACGPSTNLRGITGTWNERGFTFVSSPEGDFFCHVSALHSDFEKIAETDTNVLFDVIKDPRDSSRLRATNVRFPLASKSSAPPLPFSPPPASQPFSPPVPAQVEGKAEPKIPPTKPANLATPVTEPQTMPEPVLQENAPASPSPDPSLTPDELQKVDQNSNKPETPPPKEESKHKHPAPDTSDHRSRSPSPGNRQTPATRSRSRSPPSHRGGSTRAQRLVSAASQNQ